VTVNFATTDNTTLAGSDYVATSGTVTFAPGQQSQTVSVNVKGDTTFEPTESFFVLLSNASNATISDNQGIGTIVNDDSQPSISISDAAVTEGNAGITTASFTASLSNLSSQSISVNYATAGNTATSGNDFVATSGVATIAPGLHSTTVNITVNGDTIFEPNETFVVNLSAPVNATIADNQGAGTINNDDSQPFISINDVSVTEGNAGPTPAGFTVSLSNASSQTITVNYATTDNTATAGDDYINAAGTLTFTPGQTSQPLNVGINGDVMNEDTVSFNVNLSSPDNATISDSQGVGTIVDDDAPMLAAEENSQRAVALDTLLFIRDPFMVTNEQYFVADKRTRISLFATNIELKDGLVLTAQAIDSQQVPHPLQVEFVSGLPTFTGLTQIVVKLPDGIPLAADLQMTITVRGKTSNAVLVGVIP
jgi:hypothetical protein